MQGRPPEPLATRMARYTQRCGECLIWTGATSRGYGKIQVPAAFSPDGRYKTMVASHVAFFLHHGRWPNSELIMHSCDNPPCVNPLHLVEGTHQQNQEDCVRKGRTGRRGQNANHVRGDRCHNNVLSEDEVRSIRDSVGPAATIAAEFGCSDSTVRDIRKRRSWRWLL
jgi:hypothetical protein